MALAGSSVWPRAASLVGGIMCGSGTGILWRLLTQNSVPSMACLASGVYSWRFLVVKPPRGSEILAFGPFCGAICRGNRKIGLGCFESERKPNPRSGRFRLRSYLPNPDEGVIFCEPPRGSEILVFGPFCDVICRENRKI